MPALAAPSLTLDEAVAQVEATCLPEGRDAVVLEAWGPVEAGTLVRGLKEEILITPEAGYVVYIDDYPTANLFHAVRYAFVANDGTVTDVVDATFPPLNEADYQLVATEIGDLLRSVPNRVAQPAVKSAPPLDDGSRWAVLFNGGVSRSNNHPRYWNDLSNIYVTLTTVYGYADDHIIVLCSDGLDPAIDQSNSTNSDPDLDGDGDDDIMYPCDLASIDLVFGQLAATLTRDDELFVFSTDHGSSNGGWNTSFNMWGSGELTDAHFAELLADINAGDIVNTFEPCFSGGFIDNVVVPPGPRVASSACRHDEYSWAMPPDYVYDTYVFYWTAAVKGEDAYGVPVDADVNHDGIVSMREAFNFAEAHDYSDEEPQYDDVPAGIGAGISLWPNASGPHLMIGASLVDDIGGNENGKADPGEIVSIEVSLTNVGSETATGISGLLSSDDPYVTLTQTYADYPDLGQLEAGSGTPPYQLEIDPLCPIGHIVVCDLQLDADGGYSADGAISLMVGDPKAAPIGPDSYGYWAYDQLDRPGPDYNWFEIAPDAGGPGTLNGPTGDDTPVTRNLPFTFRYYGSNYSQVTISPNGWLAMGSTTSTDYTNSGIPDSDGPSAMIAAFWRDLNPTYGGTQICTYYDTARHRFLVEWYRVAHYGESGTRETFQVALYDPAHQAPPGGDGKVRVQYAQVTDPSDATFGIESPSETDGIQFCYAGHYDVHAADLLPGTAILYKAGELASGFSIELTPEGAPIVIPAEGGPIAYNVAVANGSDAAGRVDLWSMAELPNGSDYGPVDLMESLFLPAGAAGDQDLEHAVPAPAPAGDYRLRFLLGAYPDEVWAVDSFGFTKEP
jgi:hypothetical protein